MSISWLADKIEQWPTDRLVPYARNARTHTYAKLTPTFVFCRSNLCLRTSGRLISPEYTGSLSVANLDTTPD